MRTSELVGPESAVVVERDAGNEERALVKRAKAGDAAALDLIARREIVRVERLLIRMLGPRNDLEDLVQSVFVELFRSLPGFRCESTLSTFVGGITVRIARRAMRPGAWWRRRGDMPEQIQAPQPGPERHAVAEQQLRHLHRALAKLSADKRIAFILWAIEDWEVPEIAQAVQASVSAVRSRIFYARKKLKELARKDPVLRDLLEGGRDVA